MMTAVKKDDEERGAAFFVRTVALFLTPLRWHSPHPRLDEDWGDEAAADQEEEAGEEEALREKK